MIDFWWNAQGGVDMQIGATLLATVDLDEGRIPTKPLYRLTVIAHALHKANPSLTFRNNVPKAVAPWLDYWLGLEETPSFAEPDA